jgi:hypothetical protein
MRFHSVCYGVLRLRWTLTRKRRQTVTQSRCSLEKEERKALSLSLL